MVAAGQLATAGLAARVAAQLALDRGKLRAERAIIRSPTVTCSRAVAGSVTCASQLRPSSVSRYRPLRWRILVGI